MSSIDTAGSLASVGCAKAAGVVARLRNDLRGCSVPKCGLHFGKFTPVDFY